MLRVDFGIFVDESANRNVCIGGSDAERIRDTSSYEMNNLDTRANHDHRTWIIVHVAKPMSVVNTEGRWDTYKTRPGIHI